MIINVNRFTTSNTKKSYRKISLDIFYTYFKTLHIDDYKRRKAQVHECYEAPFHPVVSTRTTARAPHLNTNTLPTRHARMHSQLLLYSLLYTVYYLAGILRIDVTSPEDLSKLSQAQDWYTLKHTGAKLGSQ